MKTSAELQQQTFIRKLSYFGLIVVLFSVMTFSGTLYARLAGRPANWTVTNQGQQLQLTDSGRGEADLAGSTFRLALSGSRGFAIAIIWQVTIDAQKKHEWDEVELLVNTITKLQPHFLTPWLFQSWNLAYNVSVESDRVRDKYFYISRGIELLADGERINRARGIEANGQPYEVGNPDMRFWVGFYYANKFGQSDEQNTLRSLLQLSCIDPSKRDPNMLMRDKREVDMDAFREFVRRNPVLCRRLRNNVRAREPKDVVAFLEESLKIPTRYEEVDGRWQLKRPESQFPVLPVSASTEAEVSPYQEFAGNFDSYHCAWAWHSNAQEPLPPVEKGKPAAGVPKYDPLRFRMPRSPASIIFRQQPARGLSYIAERLQKEGWFDDQGWEVDADRQTDQWFPEEKLIVGNDPRYSSLAAWEKAHGRWNEHGIEHGFLLSEAEIRNLNTDAELFRKTFGSDNTTTELIREQVTDEMWKSFDAHKQLRDLEVNRQMTNFRHFLYRSEAESDERTMQMRRALYHAERLNKTGNHKPAIRLYGEAFDLMIGNRTTGKEGIFEKYPDFRKDTTIQEELLEKHIDYLILLESQNGPMLRSYFTSQNAIAASTSPAGAASLYSSLLYQYYARPRELPDLFLGPLDGVDRNDRPWITLGSAYNIKVRRGLIKVPNEAPEGPGGPPPGSPH